MQKIRHTGAKSAGSLITKRRYEVGWLGEKKLVENRKDLVCTHKYMWGESECRRGEAEGGTDAKWIGVGCWESEKDTDRKQTSRTEGKRRQAGDVIRCPDATEHIKHKKRWGCRTEGRVKQNNKMGVTFKTRINKLFLHFKEEFMSRWYAYITNIQKGPHLKVWKL